jgi:biopolymer transport protein ExbD
MNFRRKSKVSTEFSLASMSDMIFLLLIFFLITSTMVSPNGVKVVLPKLSNKKPQKESVTISITPDAKFFLNKNQTTVELLPSQLQTELSGVENPTVSIAADKSVPYEEVMKVIKVATELKYGILLKTERE